MSILVPPKRSARENPTSGSRGDSCDIILFLVLGSVVSEFRSSVTARAGPEGKAFCTTRDRARRLRLNVRNTSVRLSSSGCAQSEGARANRGISADESIRGFSRACRMGG